MPLILGTNSIKDTGYNVANSCRFNSGSSDYLNRTPDSAGNLRTMTFSFWMKRSKLTSDAQRIFSIFNNSGADQFWLRTADSSNDYIDFFSQTSSTQTLRLVSSARLRDVSAWYHIVIAVDTTQGTNSNRIKMYINGVQQTSFSTTSYPSQNTDLEWNKAIPNMLGAQQSNGTAEFIDMYLAEVCFIDGQQLAPTSFGEFDEDSGIWKPIDVSGLTFGTNGFYLDFENSSALGNDANGSNNFTVNNLTAIDQSTDTCTNNSCVINSLDNHFYNATLSEGNLKQTANASNYSFGTSTFGVSQGKWVVEIKIESGSTVRNVMGITDKVSTGTTNELGNSGANAWQYSSGGNIYNNGSDIGGSYASFTTNDIIGIYLDLDNNKLYFSKNGTVQNSGTGISITAPSSTTNGVYFFAFGDYGASDDSVNNVNFGSPAFAISSGNTDGEYGNFEYTTTITGDSASKTFKALNTKNLAEYG